jgi:hypothetical protein
MTGHFRWLFSELIEFQRRQVLYMEKSLSRRVAERRLSQRFADRELSLARAILAQLEKDQRLE